MYFTNTPSLNSIEAMMKRPPGTLRCRLHRTLKKLRETLDEETD